MASPAQNFANRDNSKHSTGPRTPEGKSASSQNAKTHGFNAAEPVLASEDRVQFDELRARYLEEFKPATPSAEFLVDQLVATRWKLDRLERMETDMFAALENLTLAMTDKETRAGFAMLDRYRNSFHRIYHRCLRDLHSKMQNEAKSSQLAQTKFEALLKQMLDAPPPRFRPKAAGANTPPAAATDPSTSPNDSEATASST